ncbi:hypothetical protein [uncultured Desulfobacter sp.]|uniref:hypothetical protein n=1 Tax=uncultured Desulfobacter sp. TaxID=240139 RepID=UPI002AAA8690|nr:hypothetical protein [uncultured Desulfobacter sp.]
MSKTLYFLIGPKGSGKTFIGTHVNKSTDIYFLRVEPIWVALKENENGWQKVIEEINQSFTKYEKVMIENIGAGDDFKNFLSILQNQYQTKIIQVKTDLSLCYKRVKERNNSNHIPVSDDKVKEYNEIASKVTLNWDLVVDNNGSQHIDNIVKKIMYL